MEQPTILKTLHDAQVAHQAGDFVNALKFYEHFFNHALDDDPYALYGVRLSYCLDGWAKLAETFPGAKSRLVQKQRDVFEEYRENKVSEKFHDYYCISKALGQNKTALEEYCQLFQNNPRSAEKLAKYVWDDLVQDHQWAICGKLLTEPAQKIDELFSIYDEAQSLKSVEPSFDNKKFDQHLIDTLLSGVSDTVQVLRYNNRSNEIASIQRQFYQALETRNHADLTKTVHAQASFLFLGH